MDSSGLNEVFKAPKVGDLLAFQDIYVEQSQVIAVRVIKLGLSLSALPFF
jgi:hypothetical protein